MHACMANVLEKHGGSETLTKQEIITYAEGSKRRGNMTIVCLLSQFEEIVRFRILHILQKLIYMSGVCEVMSVSSDLCGEVVSFLEGGQYEMSRKKELVNMKSWRLRLWSI